MSLILGSAYKNNGLATRIVINAGTYSYRAGTYSDFAENTKKIIMK